MAGYAEYSGFQTVYLVYCMAVGSVARESSYNSANSRAPRHALASSTNQLLGFEQ